MLFLLAFIRRLPLRQIGGIVAAVSLDGLAAQFPDPCADCVQKKPVMAHHKDRAPIGFQVGFQPSHGFQIQMVGWLVQNQQVRAFQQQPGQTQPGLFPAGKDPRRFCPCVSGKAHAAQDLSDLHIHMIGIHGVNDGGTLRDFISQQRVRRDSHPVLEFLHLLHRLRGGGKCLLHGLVDVVAGVQYGILFQIPAGDAAGKGRRAAVRLGLSA